MRRLSAPQSEPAGADDRGDPAVILARIAGGRSGPGDRTGQFSAPRFGRRGYRGAMEWGALLRQLGVAMVASGRAAGTAAVTSGRWLTDVLLDTAPRIPVRDLDTLRQHHPGLDTEQLADALVSSASHATAAVGVAGGALTGVQWSVPVTLLAVPVQLAVEVTAVAAIEIKLVAELHEAYGVPVRGSSAQRGAAYAMSWANRRGVNPLEPASMSAAIGVVARRRLQRRLVARAGRSIGTLAPLMAGAAYGAYSNRRQTLLLADSLRGDLRRRPLATALTANAVSKLLGPGARLLGGRRGTGPVRRRRPPAS